MLWSHAGPLLPETWPSVLSANWFRPGFWGVTIFFAISGFLIIGQLLDVSMDRRRETGDKETRLVVKKGVEQIKAAEAAI